MIPIRRLIIAGAALALSACAGAAVLAPPYNPAAGDGWTSAEAATRPVGLGLAGSVLAPGVTFAGGVQIVLDEGSPLHSLSDLKLMGEGEFVSVTDAGDLVRGRVRLDGRGRLVGVEGLRYRRLTLMDGRAIVEKTDGDAEGLAFTHAGELLVSFERNHRIWNYGRAAAPALHPIVAVSPNHAFGLNDGIEALSGSSRGWRAAGESGGVWDCDGDDCVVIVTPPATPLADAEYRMTGMDEDPWGDGWFVVQRSFNPPIDARGRVRRMAPDGTLGPVLVELKLPGTTDNFEGIAAERRGDGARLYILSDDNASATQRTLMLAFDIDQ